MLVMTINPAISFEYVAGLLHLRLVSIRLLEQLSKTFGQSIGAYLTERRPSSLVQPHGFGNYS